ncbi:MAG: type II toxin-antitoxin system HicB family antitoxin [Alphaproteobacteria bacterium]
MTIDYVAIIHKDRDSDFGVSFPDFPGCVTAGRTLEEAQEMAREALTGHIAAMRDGGDPIPGPSPIDAVVRDPEFRDGVAFLITMDEPAANQATVTASGEE